MSVASFLTITDRFNARDLSANEVAKTFVPPFFFPQLLRQCNSILVGPRGSGKTTLLKMLQQRALASWNHPEAMSFREQVGFVGIFVPFDRAWAEQWTAKGTPLQQGEVLDVAAFTSHCIRAFVLALLDLRRISASPIVRPIAECLNAEAEARLVRSLASVWRLQPQIATLRALRESLNERLIELSGLRRRLLAAAARSGDAAAEEVFADPGYLFYDMLELLRAGADAVEDATGIGEIHWGLLLDEFELAPVSIQVLVTRALRSTDQRFHFKVAMSPFSKHATMLEDALSAMPEHDYQVIQLWGARQQDIYRFCDALWSRVVQERSLPLSSAVRVLGFGYLGTREEEWREGGTAYREGSRHGELLQRAAKSNETVGAYFRKQGVDLHELTELDRRKRAATVRKVGPLLAFRDYYEKEGSKPRSRKRAANRLYTGAQAIFLLSEGNPRWFLALVGQILDRHSDPGRVVPQWIQAEQVAASAGAFEALLGTFAVVRESGPAVRLPVLLEKIAAYMRSAVLGRVFIADPPGSFIVDRGTPLRIQMALAEALNAGGVISLETSPGKEILPNLEGARFRLSFQLAPLYDLPLRLGRAINLSQILHPGDQLRLEDGS